MNNKLKNSLLTIILVALCFGILERWYKTYIVGEYYLNSGIFLAILGAILPFIIVFITYKTIKTLTK